jgi:hypothetical protein
MEVDKQKSGMALDTLGFPSVFLDIVFWGQLTSG